MTITATSAPALLSVISVAWSIIQKRGSVKSYIINEESVKKQATDSSTSKKPCGTNLASPVWRPAVGDCDRSCQIFIRSYAEAVVSIVRC